MALTPTYEHSDTFKKLTVNGSTYWLKDADLRALLFMLLLKMLFLILKVQCTSEEFLLVDRLVKPMLR